MPPGEPRRNVSNAIVRCVENGAITHLKERVRRIVGRKNKSAISLYYWGLIFGGRRGREEFKKYNDSRAVTEALTIKRHGSAKAFEEYREKQRVAGCTLDYFRERYGDVVGLSVYSDVCRKKSPTLEVYKERLGDLNGTVAFNQMIARKEKGLGRQYSSSKNEVLFIEEIIEKIPGSRFKYCNNGGQFIFRGKGERGTTARAVDLVIFDSMLCVEYDGDYWHCNPLIYSSEWYHPVRKKTAGDIWAEDDEKHRLLSAMGFHVIRVWESEVKERKSRNEAISRIITIHHDRVQSRRLSD